MATDTSTYSRDFFAKGERGMIRSAQVIVPVLMELFHPQSVIDAGCGDGWFLREFAAHGVTRLVGVEPNVDSIAAGEHVKYDLSTPLRMSERFDLCLCLEVAEHLPEASAGTLVDSLCALSDTVVFSAAIPKQGGNGHLNEQWASYWVEKFNDRDYTATDYLRWRLWADKRVEPWYAQNILCFSNRLWEHTLVAETDVVHPELWTIYRGH